jgi:hypothetical protein
MQLKTLLVDWLTDFYSVMLQPTLHLMSQSICLKGAHDQMLVTVSYASVHVRCPLWRENGSVIYQRYSQQYHVSCQYVYNIYSLHVTTILYNNVYVYTMYTRPLSVRYSTADHSLSSVAHAITAMYTRPLSVQVQYSRSFPILSSSRYNSNLNWPDLADGLHYITWIFI